LGVLRGAPQRLAEIARGAGAQSVEHRRLVDRGEGGRRPCGSPRESAAQGRTAMTRTQRGPRALWLGLRAPVIFLVLVCTAVPSNVVSPSISEGLDALSFQVNMRDVVLNVIGYVPVGIALADLPIAAATGASALLSAVAETV